MSAIEDKLAAMNIVLPPSYPTNPNRATGVEVDSVLYLSGHGTTRTPMPSGVKSRGKVGADVTEAEARDTARAVTLQVLASIRDTVGLGRVRRVIRILGLVNSAPGFDRQFAVIDGASDLFHELWGPVNGRHARAAVGVAELSNCSILEIMGEFELHPSPSQTKDTRGGEQ